MAHCVRVKTLALSASHSTGPKDYAPFVRVVPFTTIYAQKVFIILG